MANTITRTEWKALRYPIQLSELSEEEGGGWIAHIPLLGKGLFMADGETPAEATENLESLRLEMYDTVIASGQPIPLPDDDEGPKSSGRWLQRSSPSLHTELRKAAEREGVSFNAFCEELLTRGLMQQTAEESMNRLAQSVLDKVQQDLTLALSTKQSRASATSRSKRVAERPTGPYQSNKEKELQ